REGRHRQGDRKAGKNRAGTTSTCASGSRTAARARGARDRGLRVAALYDVHAMPAALAPVLAEVEREGVDAIVFGGDLFYGPLPAETLKLVRSVDAHCVRGNCDREPDDWAISQLEAEAVEWARSWPPTVEVDGVLYCHATP